jgi:hypothetical protein
MLREPASRPNRACAIITRSSCGTTLAGQSRTWCRKSVSAHDQGTGPGFHRGTSSAAFRCRYWRTAAASPDRGCAATADDGVGQSAHAAKCPARLLVYDKQPARFACRPPLSSLPLLPLTVSLTCVTRSPSAITNCNRIRRATDTSGEHRQGCAQRGTKVLKPGDDRRSFRWASRPALCSTQRSRRR